MRSWFINILDKTGPACPNLAGKNLKSICPIFFDLTRDDTSTTDFYDSPLRVTGNRVRLTLFFERLPAGSVFGLSSYISQPRPAQVSGCVF
jgi:hypothetical protein